jgi:hypothetical protein
MSRGPELVGVHFEMISVVKVEIPQDPDQKNIYRYPDTEINSHNHIQT